MWARRSRAVWGRHAAPSERRCGQPATSHREHGRFVADGGLYIPDPYEYDYMTGRFIPYTVIWEHVAAQAPVLWGLVFGFAALVKAAARTWKRPGGGCAQCGYPRIGARCPECGAAFDAVCAEAGTGCGSGAGALR